MDALTGKISLKDISTRDLITELSKRQDLSAGLRELLLGESGKDDGSSDLESSLGSQIIEQLVKQRQAYTLHGVFGLGTILPGGNTNAEMNGLNVGGDVMGLDLNPSYYYKMFGRTDADNLSLSLLVTDPSKGSGRHLYNSEIDFLDKSLKNFGLFFAYCPSQVEGCSEVIISGQAGSFDHRNISTAFRTCQRMPTELVEKLFTLVQDDPSLVELFFQKSFPKLDSKRDKFDGLYRFHTDRVTVVNGPAVEKFVKEHQKNGLFDGGKSFYYQQLIENAIKIDLPSKVGSGSVEDFIKIKNEYWKDKKAS